jgi:hypothetical protein
VRALQSALLRVCWPRDPCPTPKESACHVVTYGAARAIARVNRTLVGAIYRDYELAISARRCHLVAVRPTVLYREYIEHAALRQGTSRSLYREVPSVTPDSPYGGSSSWCNLGALTAPKSLEPDGTPLHQMTGKLLSHIGNLVPTIRIERMTSRLQGGCSTN